MRSEVMGTPLMLVFVMYVTIDASVADDMSECVSSCNARGVISMGQCNSACSRYISKYRRGGMPFPVNSYRKWLWETGFGRHQGERQMDTSDKLNRNRFGFFPPVDEMMSRVELESTVDELARQMSSPSRQQNKQYIDYDLERLHAVSPVLPDFMTARHEKRYPTRSRFLRLGRDTSAVERRLKQQNDEREKRRSRFMRLGRGKMDDDVSAEKRRNRFMRVGRPFDESSENSIENEKRRSRFMRLGRGGEDKMIDLDTGYFDGKTASRIGYFGHDFSSDEDSPVEEKRRNRFMRVGRPSDIQNKAEKRRNRFMRVGRPSEIGHAAEKRRNRFLRVGKSMDPSDIIEEQKRRNRFMRVGRGDGDENERDIASLERKLSLLSGMPLERNGGGTNPEALPEVVEEKRRNRFMRVGRGDIENSEDGSVSKRRNRFLRVGRGHVVKNNQIEPANSGKEKDGFEEKLGSDLDSSLEKSKTTTEAPSKRTTTA